MGKNTDVPLLNIRFHGTHNVMSQPLNSHCWVDPLVALEMVVDSVVALEIFVVGFRSTSYGFPI